MLSIRWNSSHFIISIKLLLNTLVHMSTSATCGWQGEGVHVEWGTFLNGDDWGRKPYQPRGPRKGRCEGGRLSKCKVEHKGPTSEPPSNNILERRSQGLSEPPAVPTVLTPDVVGFVEEGLHEAGFAEIRKAVENGGKGPNESHGGASGSAGGCGESEVGGSLLGQTGYHGRHYSFFHRGWKLYDRDSLSDYGVANESVIHAVELRPEDRSSLSRLHTLLRSGIRSIRNADDYLQQARDEMELDESESDF